MVHRAAEHLGRTARSPEKAPAACHGDSGNVFPPAARGRLNRPCVPWGTTGHPMPVRRAGSFYAAQAASAVGGAGRVGEGGPCRPAFPSAGCPAPRCRLPPAHRPADSPVSPPRRLLQLLEAQGVYERGALQACLFHLLAALLRAAGCLPPADLLTCLCPRRAGCSSCQRRKACTRGAPCSPR